jgi:hypothetical protein
MRRRRDLARVLRWYPSSWRARYGDELLALLEDRLHESPLTFRMWTSIALSGLRERCYGAGIVGARSAPATQRRTGALMVLVAWSIMIVGGASLVKTAEHFSAAMPATSRPLAQIAYNTTAVAGAVGTLLVVVAGFVALPGFFRFLRAKRWPQVRVTFVRSLAATAALIVATLALSLWAHSLSSVQRNGADGLYSDAFIVYALLVVIAIGLWTRTGVAVATRIDFTPRELRWESGLALGVCLSSMVVIVGAILWWVQLGLHAPWFLEGTTKGVVVSPWSPRLVETMIVFALGTLSALWGASRIALTYRGA